MSSNLGSSDAVENGLKSSKKRKHDGIAKESRKKRKQLDIEPVPATVDGEEGKRSEIKKERRKDKKQKQIDVEDGTHNEDNSSLVNDSLQYTTSSKHKAHKKQGTTDTNSSPSTSRSAHNEVAQISADLGLGQLTEDILAASKSTSKEDKKKRKREKQIEQELIPAQHADDAEFTTMSQFENDTEMIDAIPDSLDANEPSIQNQDVIENIPDILELDSPTSFYSTRLSLYLSIPPVATANPLSGMLSLHLTPLLLTYFPPADGVILSYYDPVLSTRPEVSLNKPLAPPPGSENLDGTFTGNLTKVGDEAGACWAWLTVTFLVFKPERGDELKGWTNVMSEGFIGIVCYNYFQTAISKVRIPRSWTWTGASRSKASARKASKKGKLNDVEDSTQESVEQSRNAQLIRADDAIDGGVGTFLDESGSQMPEITTLRVIDLEMVPAADRGKWSLQIEGTLLDEEEEAEVRDEERQHFEDRIQSKSRSRSRLGTPLASGGLAVQSRASSLLSTA